MKHADRDVLDILVEYLYKNSVKLEAITVWKVLHFANYYGINTLANECLTYLQNRINIYNCIKIYHSTLKCTHFIVNLTQTFLKTNFCKVCIHVSLAFITQYSTVSELIFDLDCWQQPRLLHNRLRTITNYTWRWLFKHSKWDLCVANNTQMDLLYGQWEKLIFA